MSGPHRSVTLGLPERDAETASWCELIRAMGEAGVTNSKCTGNPRYSLISRDVSDTLLADGSILQLQVLGKPPHHGHGGARWGAALNVQLQSLADGVRRRAGDDLYLK